MSENTEQDIWLIYDGKCPICNASANALKIRDAVGTLHLVNARNPHPILKELKTANLNLDEGMVVKFNGILYHGADAQHILALIGSTHDWFNKMNVFLFRSKLLGKFLYKILRFVRNIVLQLKGISKLNNLGKHHG